ncbi:hypothetical protein [Micromonospora sp. DT47]|uniref:hypothetical protein n=1 Tax=Micromonospora sp. DT47 TaxID=3393431 RepID=UPI003CF8865B
MAFAALALLLTPLGRALPAAAALGVLAALLVTAAGHERLTRGRGARGRRPPRPVRVRPAGRR